jgi:hypothetical protein
MCLNTMCKLDHSGVCTVRGSLTATLPYFILDKFNQVNKYLINN